MSVRHLRSWPLLWLALALLYWATGRLCILASAYVANVSWLPFLPAGFSLAAALLWGARVGPGVFLGQCAVGLTSGVPLAAVPLMAFGNAAAASLAGWWFHDRPGRRLELDRLRDVVSLLVAELLVLEPLSTLCGVSGLVLTDRIPTDRIVGTGAAWYFADLLAKFAVAPMILAWLRWPRPAQGLRSTTELGLLGVFTLLFGLFCAGRWSVPILPFPVALVAVVPLLGWAAMRFVPSVAITVGALLGVFAFDAVLAGTGPFPHAADGSHIIQLNVFLGVCLGTGLFLSAAMGQLRKAEREQAALVEQLRASHAQVTRLQEFITFCAWTGRVRWKGEWVSVEQFLLERYNLNVSHGISEDAVARVMQGQSAPGATGNEGDFAPEKLA